MSLRCPHCGEQIVSRGVGKCPGCYKVLPDELQLTQREKELDRLDNELNHRRMEIFDGVGRYGTGGYNQTSIRLDTALMTSFYFWDV